MVSSESALFNQGSVVESFAENSTKVLWLCCDGADVSKIQLDLMSTSYEAQLPFAGV